MATLPAQLDVSTPIFSSACCNRAARLERAFETLRLEVAALLALITNPSPIAAAVHPVVTVAVREALQRAEAARESIGCHGAEQCDLSRDRRAQAAAVKDGSTSAADSVSEDVVIKDDEVRQRKRRRIAGSGSIHPCDDAITRGDSITTRPAGSPRREDDVRPCFTDPRDRRENAANLTRAAPLIGTTTMSSTIGHPQDSFPIFSSSACSSLPLLDSASSVTTACSSSPIAVLRLPTQLQYTVTRKDAKRLKPSEKETLVDVDVRIMGTHNGVNKYLVAKDVCQLITLTQRQCSEGHKAVHGTREGVHAGDVQAQERQRMCASVDCIDGCLDCVG